MNFTFDERISKEVLENYLSRSVTAAGLYESKTLEDDLRAIKEMGAKFLGRASGIWYMMEDDEEHFRLSRELAEKVHGVDPEIILQSCVFEWITGRIEEVKIPAYVFEAFGLEPEDRTFRLVDTLFLDESSGYIDRRDDQRKNGGIPDLSRQEARMWFYYRATRYIDCGYEALHLGQVHLYTANDTGMALTVELFGMIREYARTHARRHKVLLDAHTHGVNIRGRLLFDYHAMPFTAKPLLEVPGEEVVLVREGYSEGGENINGWSAKTMPLLMEYDNWGGLVVESREALPREELAWRDWWGYDQIAWFANQPKESREHFLEYTYKWVEINNPNAYFQIPFRRILSDASIMMKRADNGEEELQTFYQINDPSENCPLGFGEEALVKKLWARNHELREKAANPEMLIRYGAEEVYDEATGMKLPEKIVVYGGFQSHVGTFKNDSNSEVTRMYYIGDNTYALSVVMPFAGTYDFSVATYGTLSATYQGDGYPRSGSSNKGHFTTEKDNMVVRFCYQFITNKIAVETFE
ncbi:MAG: hypothetical protein KH828_08100 [Clostridiales bacterium]|nr:hypothetical protein [Clostridiales bacterium]